MPGAEGTDLSLFLSNPVRFSRGGGFPGRCAQLCPSPSARSGGLSFFSGPSTLEPSLVLGHLSAPSEDGLRADDQGSARLTPASGGSGGAGGERPPPGSGGTRTRAAPPRLSAPHPSPGRPQPPAAGRGRSWTLSCGAGGASAPHWLPAALRALMAACAVGSAGAAATLVAATSPLPRGILASGPRGRLAPWCCLLLARPSPWRSPVRLARDVF